MLKRPAASSLLKRPAAALDPSVEPFFLRRPVASGDFSQARKRAYSRGYHTEEARQKAVGSIPVDKILCREAGHRTVLELLTPPA